MVDLEMQPQDSGLGDVITIIASLIAIFIFVTGYQNLPQLFRKLQTELPDSWVENILMGILVFIAFIGCMLLLVGSCSPRQETIRVRPAIPTPISTPDFMILGFDLEPVIKEVISQTVKNKGSALDQITNQNK